MKNIYPNDDKVNRKKLIKHVEECHSITVEEYLVKYFSIDIPKCKCGCGQLCSMRKRASTLQWTDFPCGKNGGWSQKAKKNRCGNKNPTFGLKPWNKGLTKDNNKSLKSISIKMTGKKKSQEHIDKMRNNAINSIIEGKIPKTLTKPHRTIIKLLEELNIEYIVEKQYGPYLFDIYLPKADTFLEIDGDYWHCNPSIYKNGPINKTQSLNVIRDINKTSYCNLHSKQLIRFWEYNISNNLEEIRTILCTLKQ